MNITRFAIETDAAGAYNGTVDTRAAKLLHGVHWAGANMGTATAVTLSVTDTYGGPDVTLLTLAAANSNAFYYPRSSEHDSGGTALATYTLPVVAGSLKVAITTGGSVTLGTCTVYLLEA